MEWNLPPKPFLKDLEVAAGKGLRLFEGSETPIPLKLISLKILSTGVLDLVYGPGESRGDATAVARDAEAVRAMHAGG